MPTKRLNDSSGFGAVFPVGATRWVALLSLLFFLIPMVCAAPAAPQIHVSGAVAKPTDWTAAQLGKDLARDVQTVHYTVKGVAHMAHAVPLLAVIEAAQPDYNAHIKNHRLQFVVAVQGFDGYTVDFSLAEMLPEIGHRAVWLALDEDGRPLAGDAGPGALIAPDDAKPGRWVHGVRAISVIDGAQAASSGSGK